MRKILLGLIFILLFITCPAYAEDNLPLIPNVASIRENDSLYALAYNRESLEKLLPVFNQYDGVGAIAPGDKLIAVQKDKLWGLLELDSGNIVCQPKYKEIWQNIRANTVAVRMQDTNDKYGFLDPNGNVLVEPKYDYTENKTINGGAVVVGRDFGYTAIDMDGNELFPLIPYMLHQSMNGKYFWYNDDTRYTVIDRSGNIVGTADANAYDVFGFYDNNFDTIGILVGLNGKAGLCDFDFSYILPMEYENIEYLDNLDIFYCVKNHRVFYLDKSGNVIGGRDWEYFQNISYGNLLAIRENGKYGFMDKNGNIVIAPKFQHANVQSVYEDWFVPPFKPAYSLYCVKLNGKTGIINNDGSYLLAPKWDLRLGDLTLYRDGHITFWKDGKCGLIDKNGNLIIPPTVDGITRTETSWVVTIDGKNYDIKLSDNPVPLSYEFIIPDDKTPEMEELVEKGILQGDANGDLRLWDFVTRAEFVAILARAKNWDTSTSSGVDKFTDIDNHWAKNAIIKASNDGLINGYGDGTFCPDAYITLNQAYMILFREIGISDDYIKGTTGIVNGEYDMGSLAMQAKLDVICESLISDPATRGDIAKVIYKFIHSNMTAQDIYNAYKPPVIHY